MDKYNRTACEFHILRRIEQKMLKVKDRISIFYKQIETIGGEISKRYQEEGVMCLQSKFGYKTSIIRDEENEHIFEIY